MANIPEHLNVTLFRDALAKTLNENVQIKDLIIVPDKASGGYCSDIYRVTVKYTVASGNTENAITTEREANLLVKEMFEALATNSREHLMYATVLPEFHAILREAGIETELAPKAFYTKKTERELHIMEDFSPRGYKILDRLVGFNVQQMKGVLKKLGQFHAASMLYKESHPDIVASMKGFYCLSDESLMAFTQVHVDNNTNYVTKIVETWPGYEKIAEKMRKNTGEIFKKKFLSLLVKEYANISVVSHGDVWINNILMLDNGKESDAVFLDYQNSCDISAAIDVVNVFMTSATLDVLKNHRESLIEYYHSILVSTLNALGYSDQAIPTLPQLLDEIKRHEYFSYFVLVFPFAQTNLGRELSDMDFTGFSDEQRVQRNRENIYSNPRVLETYKYELKRLDDLGVLD